MVRTPPRPFDLETLFPQLTSFARSAVRLHPWPGAPDRTASSVGGPLLWPADEPWPVCGAAHEVGVQRFFFERRMATRPYATTPADVRRERAIRRSAADRSVADRSVAEVQYTAEERAVLDRIASRADVPEFRPGEPVVLVPVAQLFADDLPWFDFPAGTDLLQILWCPFEHEDGQVRPEARWRSSSSVQSPSTEQPEPVLIQRDGFLPAPCEVRPEQIVEYPSLDVLPPELRSRIRDWMTSAGVDHWLDLACYRGWKVAGWESWALIDPVSLSCRCGAAMTPLLTAARYESDAPAWTPVEDERAAAEHRLPSGEPTGVDMGPGGVLQIYRCTADARHPVQHRTI